MYSKGNTRSRAKVGTVRIKVSNERLQLVFRHGGKRYYISTRFHDTPLNRKLAQDLAFEIQRDIEYGEFDSTCEKYKPNSTLSTVDAPTEIAPPVPAMAELWTKYVEIRQVGKSPSTLRMYDWVAGHLAAFSRKACSLSSQTFNRNSNYLRLAICKHRAGLQSSAC